MSRRVFVYAVFLLLASVLVAVVAGCAGPAASSPDATGQATIEAAFRERRSDVRVEGSGTVTRLLADDLNDSRHQRFILSLKSGQTLLISHNIDVAPRVEDLKVGDELAFAGVYEWNEQGGLVHWTHHDPDGSHIPGWLEHRGRRYQ